MQYKWLILVVLGLSLDSLEAQNPVCQFAGPSPYQLFVTVDEGKKQGERITILNLTRSSEDFELEISDERGLLELRDGGEVVLTRDLDRDPPASVSTIQVTVLCHSRSTGIKFDLELFISVTDVNDNAPRFVTGDDTPAGFCFNTSLSELSPVGTKVFAKLEARDNDVRSTLEYSLVPGGNSEYLEMADKNTGEIVLKKKLDYEQRKIVTATVLLQDVTREGTTRHVHHNVTCNVLVTVLDSDDQVPEFSASVYRATLLDNTTAGSVVSVQPPVHAVDPDVMVQEDIIYSIEKGNEMGLFLINELTGELRIDPASSRNLLAGQDFSVVMKASQAVNRERSAVAILLIAVQPAGYDGPRFTQTVFQGTVPEDAPVGALVLTVSAVFGSDPAGRNIAYKMADNLEQFSIDSSTGEVRVASTLDFEKASSHSFRVSADDGSFTKVARVKVTVMNVNDHTPTFPKAAYDFSTVSPDTGATVGKVQATDGDPGTVLTYTLLDYTDFFSIDSHGVIKVSTKEASELEDTYKVLVEARDDGKPSRAAVCSVSFRFRPDADASKAAEDKVVLIATLGSAGGLLVIIVLVLVAYITKIRRKLCGPDEAPDKGKSPDRQFSNIPSDDSSPPHITRDNFREPSSDRRSDDLSQVFVTGGSRRSPYESEETLMEDMVSSSESSLGSMMSPEDLVTSPAVLTRSFSVVGEPPERMYRGDPRFQLRAPNAVDHIAPDLRDMRADHSHSPSSSFDTSDVPIDIDSDSLANHSPRPPSDLSLSIAGSDMISMNPMPVRSRAGQQHVPTKHHQKPHQQGGRVIGPDDLYQTREQARPYSTEPISREPSLEASDLQVSAPRKPRPEPAPRKRTSPPSSIKSDEEPLKIPTMFQGTIPNGTISGEISPGGSIRAVIHPSQKGGRSPPMSLSNRGGPRPPPLQGVFIPIGNIQSNVSVDKLVSGVMERSRRSNSSPSSGITGTKDVPCVHERVAPRRSDPQVQKHVRFVPSDVSDEDVLPMTDSSTTSEAPTVTIYF